MCQNHKITLDHKVLLMFSFVTVQSDDHIILIHNITVRFPCWWNSGVFSSPNKKDVEITRATLNETLVSWR